MKVKDLFDAEKRADMKMEMRFKMEDAKDWIIENKEVLIVVTPVVIGLATTAVKVGGRYITVKKQQDLKDLYIYDRSLGNYWELKRSLSSNELLTVERMKNDGWSLGEILNKLKVLK